MTLGLAGESPTVDTGTSVTVTVAVRVTLPNVAVTVAVPGFRATTSPDCSMAAMLVSLIDHVTVRPVSARPPAYFVVSLSCDDVPTRSVIVPGATTIEATGTGTTVICAGCFGETPDVLASMVTLPSAMPLTTPPCVTVAMVGSLVDQKIGKLLMGL